MVNQPACLGRSEPYDTLIDYFSGPLYRAAVQEARQICAECPLFGTCLPANRDEPWARAIVKGRVEWPREDAREAHRRFRRGDRDPWVLDGERAYQRIHKAETRRKVAA